MSDISRVNQSSSTGFPSNTLIVTSTDFQLRSNQPIRFSRISTVAIQMSSNRSTLIAGNSLVFITRAHSTMSAIIFASHSPYENWHGLSTKIENTHLANFTWIMMSWPGDDVSVSIAIAWKYDLLYAVSPVNFATCLSVLSWAPMSIQCVDQISFAFQRATKQISIRAHTDKHTPSPQLDCSRQFIVIFRIGKWW